MGINSIITPMNMTLVRDALCQHLANVRDEQIKLATTEATDEWIEQNLDFTIFPKRFRFPDVEDMPCVYIYFNEMDFPKDEQDAYSNLASGTLNVEYYAVGLNGTDDKDADTNASDRLDYLTAQLYKIFCSEATNVYTATGDLIKSFSLKSWKRILTPENDNTAGTILGAKFEFDVELDEPTYYATTYNIKEFYINLAIQDEYISPFVKHILKD